jgi:uncharacterized iron-regulated membrane protein
MNSSTPDGVSLDASTPDVATGSPSHRWRSLWRIHLYAGVFAMPFIVLMAFTGLVILYTQPLQDLTQKGIATVGTGSDDATARLACRAVP